MTIVVRVTADDGTYADKTVKFSVSNDGSTLGKLVWQESFADLSDRSKWYLGKGSRSNGGPRDHQMVKLVERAPGVPAVEIRTGPSEEDVTIGGVFYPKGSILSGMVHHVANYNDFTTGILAVDVKRGPMTGSRNARGVIGTWPSESNKWPEGEMDASETGGGQPEDTTKPPSVTNQRHHDLKSTAVNDHYRKPDGSHGWVHTPVDIDTREWHTVYQVFKPDCTEVWYNDKRWHFNNNPAKLNIGVVRHFMAQTAQEDAGAGYGEGLLYISNLRFYNLPS